MAEKQKEGNHRLTSQAMKAALFDAAYNQLVKEGHDVPSLKRIKATIRVALIATKK